MLSRPTVSLPSAPPLLREDLRQLLRVDDGRDVVGLNSDIVLLPVKAKAVFSPRSSPASGIGLVSIGASHGPIGMIGLSQPLFTALSEPVVGIVVRATINWL